MKMVTKCFEFEAAHKIPLASAGKCQQIHGHSYKLEISIAGEVNIDTGMIINFSDLKTVINKQIIEWFDHTFINDYMGLPTAENMGDWIWERINHLGFNICRLKLWETSDSCYERVEYE